MSSQRDRPPGFSSKREGRSSLGTRAFSTGQAARYLYVTADSVLNWIRSGALRAQRTPGGQHRILAADLIGFMREHDMSTALLEAELSVRPYCWEFHCEGEPEETCLSCIVYRAGALDCFELAEHIERRRLACASCEGCEYRERYITSTDEEA